MYRFQSIDRIKGKIKSLFDKKEVYTILVVFLTGICGFFLGRIVVIEEKRPPVVIRQIVQVPATEAPKVAPVIGQEVKTGMYVGSRSGTKYHLPTCTGAKSISEANKIWFQSKEEAERAGYSPARNCKGI